MKKIYEVLMKKWNKITAFLSAVLLCTSASFSYAESLRMDGAKERLQFNYRSQWISSSDVPKESAYDVVVFGSDPEGIAAAYSAGKQNLSVLLIDFGRDRVGGRISSFVRYLLPKWYCIMAVC